MFYYLLIPFSLWLWLGFNPFRLAKNYLAARQTNFPLLISPCNPAHVVWTILAVRIRPTLKRYLPPSLFTRFNMTSYGYEFHEKTTAHSRMGKNFVLVTSGQIELNVADPDLAIEILKRPKEFRQTLIGSAVMRIFGDNLITSDGDHWARQRKLIAANINEKISDTVFQESRRQALEMMDSYMADHKGVTDNSAEGLKSIAINVLGLAGYGAARSWKESEKKQPPLPGFKLTYIEATRLAIDHIVEASLFRPGFFLLPFMPAAVKDLGHAIKEFPAHTQNMLDGERKKPSGKVNMMSMLVKESDSVRKNEDEKDNGEEKPKLGLSEDEIMGNLFVFTAAGFDTTATAMAYAVTLLAAYPEWQKWLCEELDDVLPSISKSDEQLEYSEIFPKLVRTLAVMYETLRLFPPVLHVAKGTLSPVTLTHPVTGTAHHIPANTLIYINNIAIQSDPSIYSPDPTVFRPSRFIDNTTPKRPSIKNYGKGTFLSWSAGPRICPGAKMSQVEFVSVFATIFRRWKVELVLKEGESAEQARTRVEQVMEDSQSRLTLQMNRPREVKLRFSER